MKLLASTTHGNVRPWPVSDVVIGRLDRRLAADQYLRVDPWFHAPGEGTTFATLDAAIAAAQLASRDMTSTMQTPNATLGVFGSDSTFGIAYLDRCDWSGTAGPVHSQLGSDRERSFTTYDETLRALVNATTSVLVGPPGTTTPLRNPHHG